MGIYGSADGMIHSDVRLSKKLNATCEDHDKVQYSGNVINYKTFSDSPQRKFGVAQRWTPSRLLVNQSNSRKRYSVGFGK